MAQYDDAPALQVSMRGREQHNFVDLLKRAAQEGVTFCPLSELLSGTLPLGQVVRGNIAGREGWLGCQQMAGSH